MKYKRLALLAAITVLSITTLIEGKADPAQLFIPAGYQSYYVLGNSTLIINQAVDIATGNNPSASQPYSVFSLVSYQNRSRIYVDQKSNGYTFHPSNFTGADAVFELDKGGVLILDNWANPYFSIEPPGRGFLVSGSLGPVDGGDYFYVAGGPVNVFRGATDRQIGTGPDGNYVAGMWELYSLEHGGEDSQMSYVVPVGEDTLGTPDFNGGAQELRGGTYLVVQSTEDGTVVNYTIQGTPYTRNMSRGESFVMQHIHQSDTVDSNKKVQVGLIGSGGESFDIRYFTLSDANFTGNDYWIPTFPSAYPVMNIRFHIYAITDANVTITTDSGVAPGWNGKHLSASTRARAHGDERRGH